MKTRRREDELVRDLDAANDARGALEREFAAHCRKVISRGMWDIAMDLRAGADTECDRCGGPIPKGERIITTPSKARPSAVIHRSCLRASHEQTHRCWLANRRKQREPEPVDPRQGALFDNDRARPGKGKDTMQSVEARKSEVLTHKADLDAPDIDHEELPPESGDNSPSRGQRLDPVTKARRNPKSRKLAIAAKCYDCQGGGIDPGVVERIRTCLTPGCPLYPVRPYKDAPEAEAVRLAALAKRAEELRAKYAR